MNNGLLFSWLLLFWIGLSPQLSAQIQISSETPVSFDGTSLTKDEDGQYLFEPTTIFPNIFTLSNQQNEWEIYWEPGKNLRLNLTGDSLTFVGDLVPENQYLLSEKRINNEVSSYLKKNWYVLHKREQGDYLEIIDSIKMLYVNFMEKAPGISTAFKQVNTASINFAFGRMILRYPQFHQRFTGQTVKLPDQMLQPAQKGLDELKYAGLSSYKKYVRSWLDLEVQKKLAAKPVDTTIYKGLIITQTRLDIIAATFTHPELQEHWSLESIKAHIEQYTWRNGRELLQKLENTCQSAKVKVAIQAFKEEIHKERKDLETVVYKTVKGLQLEVHIYKPKNFDPSRQYAALAAFHGGGWIVGDAFFTTGSAQHAAKNGLLGFSVEYRLSNQDDITPKEAMEDTRDFIRWLRQHAATYSVDPNRIIAKGLSAGGHLVSSISVIQEDPQSVPNAMILISPALDTKEDPYFKGLLHEGEDVDAYSPIKNLQPGLTMPRTLVLQGRTDHLTPTKYTEEFTEAMTQLGYDCELVIYENCGHLFTPSHLDDRGWPQSDPEIVRQAFVRQAAFYQELGYIDSTKP